MQLKPKIISGRKTNFIPKPKPMLRCPTCHCQKTEPTGRTASAEVGEWDAEHQRFEEEPELVEISCTACESYFYLPK